MTLTMQAILLKSAMRFDLYRAIDHLWQQIPHPYKLHIILGLEKAVAKASKLLTQVA